jgi:hypothetical protein
MKRVIVFFVVGIVFLGFFSAQSANAQNANVGQRIIGTWVDHTGVTWIFNANGNLTCRITNGTTVDFKFGLTDSKIFFMNVENPFNEYYIFNISISSDGRTLILEGTFYFFYATAWNSDGSPRAGERRERNEGYWLTKR